MLLFYLPLSRSAIPSTNNQSVEATVVASSLATPGGHEFIVELRNSTHILDTMTLDITIEATEKTMTTIHTTSSGTSTPTSSTTPSKQENTRVYNRWTNLFNWSSCDPSLKKVIPESVHKTKPLILGEVFFDWLEYNASLLHTWRRMS